MAWRSSPRRSAPRSRFPKLFLSKPGGTTIYEFDEGEVRSCYYTHLDRYAEGLREGARVKRGDLIAYVGSTGNADPRSPHLHFAVYELGPKREWWLGAPIDPHPDLLEAARRAK